MKSDYKCLIIDDEQDAINQMVRLVNMLFSDVNIIGTYLHWKDAFAAMRDGEADLVFLDISMGGMNGLDILKILPGIKSEVILVTAHSNFAIEAFKLAVSGYVLKPIATSELTIAVEHAIERINTKREAEQNKGALRSKISIPIGNGINYFDPAEIIYFEAMSNYTKIVTYDGELTSAYNLGKYNFVLDNASFFQVHRSFIVNVECVTRYEIGGIAIMTNQHKIPVARNTRDDFQKRLSAGIL